MRRVRPRWAGCVVSVLLAACMPGGDGADVTASPPEGVRLEHVSSSGPVPYSQSRAMARLGADGVCLLDSYAVELQCGDRHWREVATLAREGGGPGEIGRTGALVSAPGGGIAMIESGRRVSFFTAAGAFAGSAPIPMLTAASDVTDDSMMAGMTLALPSREPVQQLRWVAASTGTVARTVSLRFDPRLVGADSALIGDGVVAPDGRILARIAAGGESHLAWYSPDGELLGLLDFPAFGTVYPTDRDIEEHIAGYRMVFRRDPAEHEVRRFASRPLGRFRRGAAHRSFQVDDAGRAWVLGTRPSDRGSFLEVFDSVDHLGAIELPGRVVAFQISGASLLALVEDTVPDADGLYPRRVDWYSIVTRAQGMAGSLRRE